MTGESPVPAWRLWPYALLQPVLTIAVFLHPGIPFLDGATAGAAILFLRARPGAWALGAWFLASLAIGLAGRSTGLEALVRSAGFAGVLVLGFLAARPDAPSQVRDRSVEAASLCLAPPVIGYVLLLLRDLHPFTYDPVLAHLDAWGPPIAWRLARAASVDPMFRGICYGAYFSLPLALVVVAESERGRIARHRSVFVAAGLAAGLGVLAYQLVPATGPMYAFAGYPGASPELGSLAMAVPMHEAFPRNAMPSLHVTWALLVAWHAMRSPTVARVLAASFVALTVVATMALGEHYAVDLLLALPFAYGVAAAMAGHRRAASLALGGVAAVLLWIAALTP